MKLVKLDEVFVKLKKFQIPVILTVRASVGAGVGGSDRKKIEGRRLKKKNSYF